MGLKFVGVQYLVGVTNFKGVKNFVLLKMLVLVSNVSSNGFLNGFLKFISDKTTIEKSL